MVTAKQLKSELNRFADKKQAINLQRFFKTGKGEYGEGDVFIGLRVPQIRKICKQFYRDISLSEIEKLLHSKIHEHRMTALLLLVYKVTNDLSSFNNYDKVGKSATNPQMLEEIYKLYLKNTKYINNWDLVDVTTPQIVGEYLLDKDRKVLYKLVKSKDLWERRIAILATFTFIKNNQFDDTLKIADILLSDDQDLIHKAVGWMLREVGNRDRKVEEKFLKSRYKKMPRTMLRYAIEKFPKNLYQKYLRGEV